MLSLNLTKKCQVAFFFALSILVQSCIKKEPLNAECDIVSVTLSGDKLNREPQIFNDKVILIVKNDVSVSNLAPEFTLTPGATISPESGTPRNFILPQQYVVTSQDGEWKKTYTVEVRRNNSVNLYYEFENVRIVSALGGACSYDVFFEVGTNGKEDWSWASANPAYALTLQASVPSSFPTYQGDAGKFGKCAVLVTKGTGDFGQRVGKPLAAGNLYIGKFDMTNALKNPLESTQMGAPFNKIPVSLNGFYKYTPGAEYCAASENGELIPQPDKVDEFNLYAVFFESVKGSEWLDGTNVLSLDNPNIVATAIIDDKTAKEDWTAFSIPFVFREGKTVDPEKLRNGKYSLTVLFTSSKDGDYFSGAIGSTLMIDGISIVCQDK
mgnify:CR=1 FL=1